MSETDPVPEVEELKDQEPEYPGDFQEPEPVVEDEPTEPEDEGTVEEQAEEASEESEETDEEASPSEEDGVLDLSTFPEEYRERAQKYGDQRIAGIQGSWQEKIEAAKAQAKDHEAKATALDAMDAEIKKDAKGFIHKMIQELDQRGLLPNEVAGPSDPGEMPDPSIEPAEWKQWFNATQARDAWKREQEYTDRERKLQEQQAPVDQLLQRVNLVEQIKADQKTLEADDEEMGEIVKLHQQAAGDRNAALKVMQELVRLRKQNATRKAVVKEAKAGTEEKPGLSRTKARRARPRPTGDPMTDVLAELEHDGVKIPDDL